MNAKNLTALTLGEIIQTHRRRSKISQAQLAQEVGVHLSSICRWERGQATEEMAVKHFLKIVQTTKIPVSEFLPNYEVLENHGGHE